MLCVRAGVALLASRLALAWRGMCYEKKPCHHLAVMTGLETTKTQPRLQQRYVARTVAKIVPMQMGCQTERRGAGVDAGSLIFFGACAEQWPAKRRFQYWEPCSIAWHDCLTLIKKSHA